MFVIVIAFSFFLDGGSSYIAATLMMFMMMTASTCFNYDESSHWDRYAVALPVSRSKIVLSRYVTAEIMGVATTVLAFLLACAVAILKKEPEGWFPTLVAMTAGIFSVHQIVIGVSYPIAFRFTAEKARYAMMAIALIPFLGLILGMRFFESFFNNLFNSLVVNASSLVWLLGLVPVVAIGLFILSYFISVYIYKKREF